MIRFFVKKHMAVFSLAVLIVIIGIIAYAGLPRESWPEIKAPYVFVYTSYPGVAAKDIESIITQKIEQELDGLQGIKEISSTSSSGLSSIFIEFNSNVLMADALSKVKERVDLAKPELPDDVNAPFVKEFNSDEWPICIVSITHKDGISVIDSQAKELKDELKRISGVLDVEISGGLQKEVSIELDFARLEYYDLSLYDVQNAINNENLTIPGGMLNNDVKNYNLAVTGEITDYRDFAEIVVKNGDTKVKLSSLGTISFQPEKPSSYARVNGKPAISLEISKRNGANIIELINEVKKKIDENSYRFPEGTEFIYTSDESITIRTMVADLENNMFTGFVLVILVTLFFLGLRNSFFVSLAIPFSMLLSFFILQLMGITMNMIVLFSLILALGMLVDNGIVIVENIFRHGGMGKSRKEAAIEGAKEVAGPIIASTLTTCLAFLPIVFMPGFMGEIMSYVPKTVIVVLCSSLFVALVLNPVFCASFLSINEKSRRKMMEGGGGFQKVQHWYGKALVQFTAKAKLSVFLSLAVVVLGIALYALFGRESIFFPNVDPGAASISLETPTGTPLEITDSFVQRIEKELPGVKASIDNYEVVSGTDSSNKARIRVYFDPYKEREIPGERGILELKKTLAGFTGASIEFEQSEEGPPAGADISLKVVGDEYDVIGKIIAQIENILHDYPEFKEVDHDFESSEPEYEVTINRAKAAAYGLSTVQIASTIRNAMNGYSVGKYRENQDEFDIQLRYNENYRNSLGKLSRLVIQNNDGKRIPLNSIATILPKNSVGIIKRKDLNRTAEIAANFYPGVNSKAEIGKEIDGRIAELKKDLPAGYLITKGSGTEDRDESQAFLIQAFIIALFLIFIVLIAQFNSVADPMIIMISVFLSMGGVVWGFFITGMNFVIIMSGIGCIALAGVAVNNCIVLVDYTKVLMKQGMPWREAIIEAGKTRLRPVLLTALTTVLALIPMAVGISFDVHSFTIQTVSETGEYWKAFSWTMIFGLTFATFMTLVIVPSLLTLKFAYLEKRKQKKERKAQQVAA